MSGERCGGCPHEAHRRECKRKGPSRCLTLVGRDGTPQGVACASERWPCPCARRECPCGQAVAVTWVIGTDADGRLVERGTAGAEDGTLAVRRLADGTLGCRVLRPGEEPAEREWRGREHSGACAERVLAA